MRFTTEQSDKLMHALIDAQGGDPGHDIGDDFEPDNGIEVFIQNRAQEAVEIVCDILGRPANDPDVFRYVTERVSALAKAMSEYPPG